MSIAEGVDGGIEAAVRVSQGYCIYAGCFPINVIPPPLSMVADLALNGVASRVPAVRTAASSGGALSRQGGLGLTSTSRLTGMLKLNTASAWIMGDGLGAPTAVGTAADKWFDAAGQLTQARQALEELCRGVSAEDWTGDDRDAFDKEISQLAQQIGDAELFANAVAWSLVGAVVPLGAWPLGCTIVGVIQFTNASLFYAAVASIVGNLGPSEALYASGLATSITCNRSLSIGGLALGAILGACAVAIAGFAINNAVQQDKHGDADAWADLARATIEMSIEQGVKNLAASGINAISPWQVDVADRVLNPGEYAGNNNDRVEELVDDQLGGAAEQAGNEGGRVIVGENEPDRGPFSR